MSGDADFLKRPVQSENLSTHCMGGSSFERIKKGVICSAKRVIFLFFLVGVAFHNHLIAIGYPDNSRTSKNLVNRYKFNWLYWVFSLILCGSINVYSQPDSSGIYDLTLDQLSKLQITSISKVAQNLAEVPSTVHVITAAEIKDKGAFSLEEALADLPGFQFRNIQGINSYVFQRGIPNQNNLILVLIDGVQINELNSGGFYAGAQYNLANVDRIEVVYGPASVAYGTNAVSGLINIITKSALEGQAKVSSSFGSFNTLADEVNYCYTNKEKTFGLLFSGVYKKTGKADLKGSDGDNNWTDKMNNFEDDYSFDLKAQSGDFILGVNYLYKQASTATLNKSVGTIYRDYGTSWNIRFINSYLKYSKNITDNLTISSTVYNRDATVLDNTIYYVVDTAQVGYYRPNNLTGFEGIVNYTANSFFSCTGGFTLEYERLAKQNTFSYSDSPSLPPPTPRRPVMVSDRLASLFIEPRFVLAQSLFLSGGVRYDNSSTYDQVLTPRAGLSYNFLGYTWRISYAGAFRAPKPWDYSDGLGNSSLMPEKMKSLETSLAFCITDNIKADIVGYKNKLAGAISKEVTNAGYRWINGSEVNTDGVEINLGFASQKLKSFLNYTFTQSYNELHEFVPEISKHSGNASITWSFERYFKVNVRANYVGARKNPKLIPTTNSWYIDPFVLFHCTLTSVNYKGFDAQFSVKNIFNTEYYHSSNRDPSRYRQPQRTLLLSMGYTMGN